MVSTLSERVPLSTVPTIQLDDSGEPTLLGRSSNSSHYQLSTNKQISRVHIQATYYPVQPPDPEKVEVICLGWNGAKIHCQGKAWELAKDDSFTSETPGTDIMIDVQDARVVLQWPRRKMPTPSETDSGFDSENSPRQGVTAARQRSPFSSPLRQHHRIQSPVSPSPMVRNALTLDPLEPFSEGLVQIYEDSPSDDGGPSSPTPLKATQQSTQILSQPFGTNVGPGPVNFDIASDGEKYSDQDEENDPIIHSFGPHGANLGSRMAAMAAATPARPRNSNVLKDISISPQNAVESPKFVSKADAKPTLNHIVNQLAFSRLSSTPLSTLLGALPPALKCDAKGTGESGLTTDMLKKLLLGIRCVGTVSREGKDAAGRPLENEYYYIPDLDLDEKRRDAVVEGLKKPGLRACRKQHKVSNETQV